MEDTWIKHNHKQKHDLKKKKHKHKHCILQLINQI